VIGGERAEYGEQYIGLWQVKPPLERVHDLGHRLRGGRGRLRRTDRLLGLPLRARGDGADLLVGQRVELALPVAHRLFVSRSAARMAGSSIPRRRIVPARLTSAS